VEFEVYLDDVEYLVHCHSRELTTEDVQELRASLKKVVRKWRKAKMTPCLLLRSQN
jgi:hypothetical protein